MTGLELKALLRSKRRTQAEYADFIGLSLRQVQRWTTTDDELPKWVTITVNALSARGQRTDAAD